MFLPKIEKTMKKIKIKQSKHHNSINNIINNLINNNIINNIINNIMNTYSL